MIDIAHNLKIYFEFIKLKFARRMAYRTSFFASLVAFFSFQFLGPIFVGVVYYSGGTFKDWSMYQILLLQGTASLVQGFSFMTVMGMFWRTQEMARKGRLDILLIRPINSLWLSIMNGFDEEDISQVVGGLIIFFFAYSHLESVDGSWFLFLALLLFGFIFFFSIALLCSAAAIKFINVHRLFEIIDVLTIFNKYPRTVYSEKLGFVFTAIIPLFVVSFFPASALLGFALDGIYFAIIADFVLLSISLLVWHKALKNYASAGG